MSDKYFSPSEFKLSFADRVIGAFSGKALERRMKNKASTRYAEILTRSAFKAAESNRMNYNWVASNQDINLLLQTELSTMRSRSRWLFRNNPYAKSALNTYLNYCVGVGFDLQMNVSRASVVNGTYTLNDLDAYNDYVEYNFGEWASDVNIAASVSCPDTFHDQQRFSFARVIEDGEVFIHLVKSKSSVLQLENIEPEALDLSKTSYSGNPIILGVELDKRTWRPVAYWVMSVDAGSVGYVWDNNSVRVPAEDMVHAYVKLHPRQMRGIPWIHASSEKLFQLEEFSNAHLVRSKLAAMFGIFLEGGDGSGMPGIASDTDTDNSGSVGFPVDSHGNRITSMAPGMMGSLPAGVKPSLINPSIPENTFDPFTRSQLIAVGAGMEYGMSYPGLTRDTSRTTFASGRASMQMDLQGYRPIQKMIGNKICSPVFRAWHDQSVLLGGIFLDASDRMDYSINPKFWQKHSWLPGGWSWGINPQQEVRAAVESMKSGITTLPDECSSLGLDWKVQLVKQKKVEMFAKSIGLNLNLNNNTNLENVNLDQDEADYANEAKSEDAAMEVENNK